jgi:hypothetical protein
MDQVIRIVYETISSIFLGSVWIDAYWSTTYKQHSQIKN